MPTPLNIKITSQDGITLHTKDTYSDKDVRIVPHLEDKVVALKSGKQIVTASEGHAGMRSVEIDVPVYNGEVEVL